MDSPRSLLLSAGRFFFGTLLSRFSGMVREMALAACFGASAEIAAFMVAYRLANLFRRLFGEGNLQAGFVPHFEALRQREGEKSARLFFRDANASIALWTLAALLPFELLLWLLGSYLPAWREISLLAMMMAPSLLFICLSSLSASFLQCEKRFFLPAAAPVLFNGVWIGAIFFVAPLPPLEGARLLSLFITLAFAGQWLATAAPALGLSRLSLSHWLLASPFAPRAKALFKPLSLGAIGVGATQLNSALDAIFARLADPAGPTYLWYAIRLQQLPLALFGLSLLGALLPPLTRAFERKEGYSPLLQTSLKQSALFLIPSLFALFALGKFGINLLYGRGAFTSAAGEKTLSCLLAYGIGLLPAGLLLLLASAFYAQRSYKIPAVASLLSVLFNIALNTLFFTLQQPVWSIALATSLSAWLNLALLALQLQNTTLSESPFWTFLAKLLLGSATAALATSYATSHLFPLPWPRDLPSQLSECAIATLLYLAGLTATFAWIGKREIGRLWGKELV